MPVVGSVIPYCFLVIPRHASFFLIPMFTTQRQQLSSRRAFEKKNIESKEKEICKIYIIDKSTNKKWCVCWLLSSGTLPLPPLNWAVVLRSCWPVGPLVTNYLNTIWGLLLPPALVTAITLCKCEYKIHKAIHSVDKRVLTHIRLQANSYRRLVSRLKKVLSTLDGEVSFCDVRGSFHKNFTWKLPET